MGHLFLYGEEIDSIFELIGYKENDITYSLGWILSNVDSYTEKIVEKISDKKYSFKDVMIKLQEYGDDGGFTDIEFNIDNKLFCIIEAKIGWNLPTKDQLKKYISRFKESPIKQRKLIVISECKREYAKRVLDQYNLDIPIGFISWKEIHNINEKIYSKCNNYSKKILDEFIMYLRKVITMQDKKSNMVFCVSLGPDKPEWSKLSWIDIVNKRLRYFYTVGNNWPKEPPNYIAFRYNGELQSIHHVEGYEIVTKMYKHLPVKKEEWEPTFLLKLGTAFRPNHILKNGKIYPSQHLWCMLDTFFICKTVREARDMTQKRLD